MKIIELNLTNYCNWKCNNCHSSCHIAPSFDNMPLHTVQKFLDEAILLNWNFEQIKLFGGEPTLHPQFYEIVELVNTYKKYQPNCKINLLTNGTIISHEICGIDQIFYTYRGLYETYNVAPIDLPEYNGADFSQACDRPTRCGLALSCDGKYYLCAPGLHVDRIFQFNIGISYLGDLTQNVIKEQSLILCKYCGLFKSPKQHSREQATSKSWVIAYNKYKGN